MSTLMEILKGIILKLIEYLTLKKTKNYCAKDCTDFGGGCWHLWQAKTRSEALLRIPNRSLCLSLPVSFRKKS